MNACVKALQHDDFFVVYFMADIPLAPLNRCQSAMAFTRGDKVMSPHSTHECQGHCFIHLRSNAQMTLHPVGNLALTSSPILAVNTVAAPPMNLTWFPVLLAGCAYKHRMRYIVVNMNIIIEVSYGSQW